MKITKDYRKEYLMEIVFLQTIGPLLVIFGHSINGLPYHIVFNSIKSFIYVFHMPLFFFIAGLTFYYTNKDKKIKYVEFIKKKLIRLLIPYLFWNLLFIVPKYLLSFYLSDKVILSVSAIIRMFLIPRSNIWGHMWFLVALFIVYCFAPLFLRVYEKNKYIFYGLIVLFGLLSFFPLNTDILTLADLSKDFVFFLIGMLIFENRKKIANIPYNIVLIILFCISFVIWIIYLNRIATAILCIFILLLLLVIGIKVSKKINNNIISNNSMTIYLFHWPFMILTRILVYQLLHFNYYITVLLMIISGITGPLILILVIEKLKLIDKSKFIKVIVGG